MNRFLRSLLPQLQRSLKLSEIRLNRGQGASAVMVPSISFNLYLKDIYCNIFTDI